MNHHAWFYKVLFDVFLTLRDLLVAMRHFSIHLDNSATPSFSVTRHFFYEPATVRAAPPQLRFYARHETAFPLPYLVRN
jgi:hypothetical protein